MFENHKNNKNHKKNDDNSVERWSRVAKSRKFTFFT